MLRKKSLLILSIAFFCCAAISLASVADTLNRVQDLIKKKDFLSARNLLTQELKTSKSEYRLWLALGYVYEAEQKYDLALKAFSYAGELKTNIPGLPERILRLQEIVSVHKAEIKGDAAATKKQSLLERARYLIAFEQPLEGFQTFYEAVEADRSILSNDYGIIQKGLAYFEQNRQKLGDAEFFIGAFQYYAGHYEKSSATLENFIKAAEDSPRVEDARKLLAESREIIRQASVKPIETPAAAKANPVNAAPKPTKQPVKKPKAEPILPTYEPSAASHSEIEFSEDEHSSITMAKAKALDLLEKYDEEGDSRLKLQIIWRLGLIALPVPEVMARMAEFLGSDDIQTVVATLEALVKIGDPGAKICAPHIVNLLDHDEYIIKWSAVRTLGDLPLLPERSIPRLFKIYKNESRSSRKGLLLNVMNAFGTPGISVLKDMLEEATGPNKRPIAEVLSALTGEDVESLIRDS